MQACRLAAGAICLLLASCVQVPPKASDSPPPATVVAPRYPLIIRQVAERPSTQFAAQDLTYNSHYPPHFPPEAIVAGHYGMVTLLIRVGANAEIDEIKVEQSSGYAELDASAVDAATHWKFMPEIKNGVPQVGWIRVPVSFSRPPSVPPPKPPYANNL